MSSVLSNFLDNAVAIHEMQAGCVGKLFDLMVRVGLSDERWGASQEKQAWTMMYYLANYAKADLRKVMSSPEAYEVLKAKLEQLRQQRGL